MLKIGDFAFDPSSREVRSAETSQRLSPKSAAVLEMLAAAEGRVLSRNELLDKVWPAADVGEEVLTQAITQIRRAFSENSHAARYVETIPKKGYRLAAIAQVGTQAPGGPWDALDPEAYASCLEADEHFDRGGRMSLRAALALYGDALNRSPDMWVARVGLAKTLMFLGAYYEPDPVSFESAKDHLRAALAADSRNAEGMAALGLLESLCGSLDRSRAWFRRSVELAPGSSETHYLLGRAGLAAKEYRLAAATLERAGRLSVTDFHSPVIAGKLRLKLGDEARARTNFTMGLCRTDAYLQSYPDGYRALRCKANCLWHLGREQEAKDLLDALKAHSDPMPYYTAGFLALIGERDQAIELLEDTVDQGWRHPGFLAGDPDFDTVRDDMRFKRIASAIGAEA